MTRPTGVTILAVLALIGGLLGLFAALGLLGVGALSGALGGGIGVVFGVLTIVIGVFTLISAVLSLAFAYGAWNLRPWAWLLGVISQGLNILTVVVNLIGGANLGSQLFSLAISGAILYYLFTPQIKRAFGR